jgi:hypothetical protein
MTFQKSYGPVNCTLFDYWQSRTPCPGEWPALLTSDRMKHCLLFLKHASFHYLYSVLPTWRNISSTNLRCFRSHWLEIRTKPASADSERALEAYTRPLHWTWIRTKMDKARLARKSISLSNSTTSGVSPLRPNPWNSPLLSSVLSPTMSALNWITPGWEETDQNWIPPP